MLKSELKVRWIFDWIETHWHIYHIYNMSDCVWACSAAPYWPKQTWLNFQTWPQKHDFWNINKENMNLSHSNTAAVSEVAQCYCTYTQKSYQASLIQPYLALPVHCGTSPRLFLPSVCACHPVICEAWLFSGIFQPRERSSAGIPPYIHQRASPFLKDCVCLCVWVWVCVSVNWFVM